MLNQYIFARPRRATLFQTGWVMVLSAVAFDHALAQEKNFDRETVVQMAPVFTKQFLVDSGQAVKLMDISGELAQDCSMVGAGPLIRVVTLPVHGSVIVQPVLATASIASNKPNAACNGKPINGIA